MFSSNEMRRLDHLISEIDAVYHEAAVKLTLSDSAMKILYTVLDSGGSCPLEQADASFCSAQTCKRGDPSGGGVRCKK